MQASSRRSILAVGGILAASFLILPGAADAQTPRRGGTAIFALQSDPAYTTRTVSSGNPDGLVGCPIYEGLTRIDGKGNVLPLLAKSWEASADGRTYTFQLQKATWHDGKPFTSADVQYTLLDVAAKYSGPFASAGRLIEAVDTPSPDVAVIRLKQAYGPILLALSCSNGGAILPAHLGKGTDILKNPIVTNAPVGTGPFMMAEWKRGDFVRMKRNPNYWEAGLPYLDELIGKVLPQANSRTQALLAGEIDQVNYLALPSNDYPIVKANPKLQLTKGRNPPAFDVMFFNVTRKPFDDERVRQALYYAMDRDYLLKSAYLNEGLTAMMPFVSGLTWSVNPEVDYRKMYPFDPAKANAMLDEAGLKRGADGIRFKMKIVYSTDDLDAGAAATAIKSMWREVGVDLVVQPMERTAAAKIMYEERDTDASIQGFNSFFDPALGMARIFTTPSIGKAYGNGAGYSNKEVDELFYRGEEGSDVKIRAPYYQKIQAILAKQLPVLTLHERIQYDGSSAALRGLEDDNFHPSWRAAWLAR